MNSVEVNPLITVCVTTYNRKNLILSTIKSILNQTYQNFEIIIVDDASSDGTEEFIRGEILKIDDRIQYIKHEINKGLAEGRNTAIFNAKGKYFTFCDDDDIWDMNFLNTFIGISKEYDDQYVFCASSISNNVSIAGLQASLKDLLILGYTPPVASQFYLTKKLKEINGYDKDIKSGVDHDLWLSLGENNCKVLWLNQDLVVVNQVRSNNRMTYNADKRIKGIEASLQVWRKRMKNSFDDNFFNCLEKNYKYNSHKKFMLYSLKNNDLDKFILHFFQLPMSFFLLDIYRFFLRRVDKNRLLKTPVFFCCNQQKHCTDFKLKNNRGIILI